MASSRESVAGAGWSCAPGSYRQLLERAGVGRSRPATWLDPRPLWATRNQVVAGANDPVNALRQAWMRTLGRDPHADDLLVDRSDATELSFLLLGDTGEGDASQYAVVPSLLTQAPGTAFMLVCSDVIYPAGGLNEYWRKHASPYRDYGKPIYAIPGNHDWYDGGEGFMRWFCGADALPPDPGDVTGGWGFLRKLLWRRPKLTKPSAEIRASRPRAVQPAPYFALDAGPVRLVGIDTGMKNTLDAGQGTWLRRVSAGSRPKVLLTGKPLYVDGKRHHTRIDGGGEVGDIVADPANGYVAAIGGDVHNYQRYLVRHGDRRIPYLVSGGGGAFMHQTHTIPNLDTVQALRGRTSEADFRCFPLRGDWLSRYSQLYARKLGLVGGRQLGLGPDEAAAVAAERLGMMPTRPSARAMTVTDPMRRAASMLYRLPQRGRGPLHVPFSEWLDWDEPPFFKHFLRVDLGPDELRIRCFAAKGCAGDELAPPVEDDLVARRDDAAPGGWIWSVHA